MSVLFLGRIAFVLEVEFFVLLVGLAKKVPPLAFLSEADAEAGLKASCSCSLPELGESLDESLLMSLGINPGDAAELSFLSFYEATLGRLGGPPALFIFSNVTVPVTFC